MDAYTLSWTVSDENLATVTANGQSVAAKNGSLVITPSGADGARTIKVVATDKAGNSTEKSVTMTYDVRPKITTSGKGIYYRYANWGAGNKEYLSISGLASSKPISIINASINSYPEYKFSGQTAFMSEWHSYSLSRDLQNASAREITGQVTFNIEYLTELNTKGTVTLTVNMRSCDGSMYCPE